MEQPNHLPSASFRRAIYAILFIASIASVVGRTMAVKSDRGKTPFLSANDRSRWATVRSLVDHGTYQLDRVIFQRPGKRNVDWYTIDLVRHRAADGREHYYSSKPPLFPTMLAGEYWLIRRITGYTLATHTFTIARIMLVVTNVIPLALYFGMMVFLVERLGRSHWGRIFVASAAAWATFLTTFGVTLNNHLPAAVSVCAALLAAYQVLYCGRTSRSWYVLAGLAAAFSVANELPALSFFCLLTAVFFCHSPRETAVWYLPSALVVAVAFFAASYAAHGDWNPAYAHRKDGPVVARTPFDGGTALHTEPTRSSALQALRSAGVSLSPGATVKLSAKPQRWVVADDAQSLRWALLREDNALVLREWDNWYEYDESYWVPDRLRGVDRGEKSRFVYAFHVLIGHHGVFVLTPIWLLSLWGMVVWLRGSDRKLAALAGAIVLLTVVCFAFYLSRPLSDRNYGGVASGFRWVFWLTPLWLVTLLPAADRLAASRIGRLVALVCFAISVFSASYPSLNPWTHPWLYQLCVQFHWIQP